MALSVKTYKMKQINPTGMSSFLSMKIDGCFEYGGKNYYLSLNRPAAEPASAEILVGRGDLKRSISGSVQRILKLVKQRFGRTTQQIRF